MSKKVDSSKVSRRTLLKGLGVFGASAWVWVPRKSFAAATPGFGTAKHVIILYAGGGLRSAPLFNADAGFQHNPFGRAMNVAPEVEWGVGSILGTQPVDLFTFGDTPIQLPPVPAIAQDIAVIAGVDHEPGSQMNPQDHFTGDMALTGGDVDSTTGLLARVHRDHPGYVNGSVALPPFDLGLSNFARGAGDFAAYRPIALQSASSFTGRSGNGDTAGRGAWARTLRETRDERFIAKRSPHVRPYLGAARDAKLNSKNYAAMLRNPALDHIGAPEGTLGGVTNQQLLEVLQGNPGGGGEMGSFGLETAFALRAVQLGVPAVSVLRYVFDTHSDEKTLLPMDAGDLGRQIAGLHFLLKRMTDAEGRPLWNDTVVVMMSEFSRDNTEAATGFNSAEGSDHQGSYAARNQSWPIFGGPITAGGRRIGALNPQTLATVGGPAKSVRSVLSTVLDVLGIDSSRHFSDAPLSELFT